MNEPPPPPVIESTPERRPVNPEFKEPPPRNPAYVKVFGQEQPLSSSVRNNDPNPLPAPPASPLSQGSNTTPISPPPTPIVRGPEPSPLGIHSEPAPPVVVDNVPLPNPLRAVNPEPVASATAPPSPTPLSNGSSGSTNLPPAPPIPALPPTVTVIPPAPAVSPPPRSFANAGAPAFRSDRGDRAASRRQPGRAGAGARGNRPGLPAADDLPQPPLGAGSPTPPARPVVPKVDSFDEETYLLKPGDTMESISHGLYHSPKYASALLLFNRTHPLCPPGLKNEPPVLDAGKAISIPPVRVLEKRFASLIPDLTPLPPAGANPPPSGALPMTGHSSSNGSASSLGSAGTPTLGNQPSPTLGNQPSPTLGNQPSPTLGNQPPPTLENQPSPTLGNQPPQTLGNQPSPTLGNQPSPTLGNQPPPSLGNQPPPTLGNQPPTTLGNVAPTPPAGYNQPGYQPTNPPPPNYRQYQVQANNETFWEIARRTLGQGERWGDIYGLNKQYNPKMPLPAGSVLRIPER